MHEGERITGIRDLNADETIFEYFPVAQETLTGIDLETGVTLFPSADGEGNGPGAWNRPRPLLEELVGQYVFAFTEHTDSYLDDTSLALKVADEKPQVDDNGTISVSADATVTTVVPLHDPEGNGLGVIFVRDPRDDPDAPDPATTPTEEEVMDQYVEGNIHPDEVTDRLAQARAAHNDVTYAAIL